MHPALRRDLRTPARRSLTLRRALQAVGFFVVVVVVVGLVR